MDDHAAADAPDHGAELLHIYDHASDEVYRYLRGRCASAALAEDITAETFLGAVGQIRRGAVEQVTTAWLIGIARHKLIDPWRRTERRPTTTVLQEHGADRDAIDSTNGEETWDAVLDRQQVGSVMEALGPHHRSALMLRYFDGLAVPEVAECLGRTVDATETLLVRARRRFRTIYERDEAGTR